MNRAVEMYTTAERKALERVLIAFPGTVQHPFEPYPEHPIVSDPELDKLLADEGFRLIPVNFEKLIADGLPEGEYLFFPYIPRGVRLWAFGPAESAKTLFFEWLAAKLTREGRSVAFVSQENPLATDVDRLVRLRPDFERLRFFHMPGLDLNNREHFLELAVVCADADLLVLDPLSALWSGDEGSNAEIVALDRDVLAQLVRLTGVTVVVIHHTGHPQAFVNRGGASAGRGASAMGQKADCVLVFQPAAPHEFTIEQSKNRTPGGHKEPKARFHIVDTPDGGLDIEPIGKAIDERVLEAMDAAVEIVGESDGLGSNALEAALKDRGFGTNTVKRAVHELRAEDPLRLRQVAGDVLGADGKRYRGKPWTLAESGGSGGSEVGPSTPSGQVGQVGPAPSIEGDLPEPTPPRSDGAGGSDA